MKFLLIVLLVMMCGCSYELYTGNADIAVSLVSKETFAFKNATMRVECGCGLALLRVVGFFDGCIYVVDDKDGYRYIFDVDDVHYLKIINHTAGNAW